MGGMWAKRERGVQDDYKAWDLRNEKNGVAPNRDGEPVRQTGSKGKTKSSISHM